MSKERKFIKFYFQFSIGQWIAALISLITTPITTWLIIPEEFGKASMFTLAFNLFLRLAFLGCNESFVRMFYERSEDERKNLLWESLIPSLSASFVVFVVVSIFWKELSFVLFGDSSYFLPVFLLGVTIPVGILEQFSSLAVRMKKRGIAFSTLRVINGVTNAVFTILYALFVSRSFYAVIVGLFFSHIVTALLGIFFERELWFGKFKLDFKSIKAIIRYGLPFVPTFLINWIFQSVDRLALRNYSDFTEIGLYSAAFKVVSVMSLFQQGFTSFWGAVAYESYEKEPERKGIFEKTSVFIAAAMFVFGLLIVVFKDVIFLLLESSYREAAGISSFLLLYPIMFTVSTVTRVGIYFKKKTYWFILISIVGACVDIVGNILLVPLLGAKGAAVSTGFSYIVLFLLYTYISKKLYPVNYHLAKFFISTFVFVIVAFINTFVINMVFQVVSAVLGLIVVMFVYREQVKYVFDLGVDLMREVKERVVSR